MIFQLLVAILGSTLAPLVHPMFTPCFAWAPVHRSEMYPAQHNTIISWWTMIQWKTSWDSMSC